jgi:hypothetical protein
MHDRHRCASGFLCREHTIEDGQRVPAQIETPTGMCRGCQRWVKRSLTALPHDWCRLKLTIGENRSREAGGGRRPKPGSRVLVNVNSDDLMRQIHDTCSAAAEIIAHDFNARWVRRRPTGRGRDYRAIADAAKLVGANIETLTARPAGAEVALRITNLHRLVVRQLGETSQREHKHLPCPSCGAQALVREVQDRRRTVSADDGSATPEVVRCLACDGGPSRDGTWTETEYEWLSTMVLSEREALDVWKYLLAERDWALARLAKELGFEDVDTLMGRLRETETVQA